MKNILFNERYRLNQAVLEGWKTKTRRIVSRKILDLVPQYQEEYYAGALESISVEDAIYNITHGEKMAKAPYHIGEEVAVAQSYNTIIQEIFDKGGEFKDSCSIIMSKGLNNKMFVHSHRMPHRIRITNVRVERLQDISDEDCLKEGIDEDKRYSFGKGLNGRHSFDTAKEAFASLIDKVSGKGTWESNPWVFVYDFELIK